MMSDTAVNDMIRVWKRARLSTGIESLGYPTENILLKAGKGRTIGLSPLPQGELTDPEIVQRIVDRMSYEFRSVFEAYHIMLIRGERCRELPHKARALALGISKKTYFARNDAAFIFCQEWLTDFLDRSIPSR